MAKKVKTKRIKRESLRTEEQTEIIRFVWILGILIILILGVYFFTRIFVTKDLTKKDNNESTVVPGEIDYNITLIGAMFTKPEKEYFVIMYDSKDINAVYYSGLASAYGRNSKALKVYTADLNNELNKKYVNKDEVNVNTSDLNSFKVGNLALLKIKEGKVEKAYTSESEIAKVLEYVKDTND